MIVRSIPLPISQVKQNHSGPKGTKNLNCGFPFHLNNHLSNLKEYLLFTSGSVDIV